MGQLAEAILSILVRCSVIEDQDHKSCNAQRSRQTKHMYKSESRWHLVLGGMRTKHLRSCACSSRQRWVEAVTVQDFEDVG